MGGKNYKLKVVATSGVNSLMAMNAAFAVAVTNATRRFLANDWGVSKDKALNDSDPMDAMGVYQAPCSDGRIFIKSDDYRQHDGSRVVTILFPSEY